MFVVSSNNSSYTCLSVGVALFAVISALRLSTHLWTVLVFSLCIGNLAVPTMSRFERYYTRLAFPFNWFVYLPLLPLVGLGSATVATVILYWLLIDPSLRTEEKISTDIRFGTLVTVIIGIGYYVYRNTRATLQTQNVKLQQAVRTGEARLEQQENKMINAANHRSHVRSPKRKALIQANRKGFLRSDGSSLYRRGIPYNERSSSNLHL